MKRPPNMIVRRWTNANGETKEAYYHRPSRATARNLAQADADNKDPKAKKKDLRKPTRLGTDYKEALRRWAEIEGAQLEPPKAGTVAEVYAKYMEWANKRNLSNLEPRTIKDRVEYWGSDKGETGRGRLCEVFGKLSINTLRPEWMLSYFEARSSQVRAKKELKFLQHMINWAKSRGLCQIENPLNNIMRLMRVDEKRDIYVEDAWYELAYRNGCQLVRDTLQFTYLCANRPDETARARFSDIDGNELVIRLAKTEKKGNPEKRIPIDGELAAYIDRQRRRPVSSVYLVSDESGQRLKPNAPKFKNEWKKARDLAELEAKEKGIPFVRFQLKDIRAKAGTDIARDYGIEAARLALGHTTQKQSQDYIRSVKGAAAKARRLAT